MFLLKLTQKDYVKKETEYQKSVEMHHDYQMSKLSDIEVKGSKNTLLTVFGAMA